MLNQRSVIPVCVAVAATTVIFAALLAGCDSQRTAGHQPVTSPGENAPAWLQTSEDDPLRAVYGGATPVHTDYVFYPRKIAVVFEFDHVVVCRACSAPSNADLPHGKILRISFDRRTHRAGGALRFCLSRRACLVR
jgi:hypothetical protein